MHGFQWLKLSEFTYLFKKEYFFCQTYEMLKCFTISNSAEYVYVFIRFSFSWILFLGYFDLCYCSYMPLANYDYSDNDNNNN